MDSYSGSSEGKYTVLKQALLIGGVLVVMLGLAAALFHFSKPKPTANNPVNFTITDSDHTLGSRTAKNVLIEYSDFECPFCKAFFPQVEQLHQDFGDSLLIVVRHFPLSQHKAAMPAALASEAAGRQGKFFEMAKIIFDNQVTWVDSSNPKDQFTQYAQSLNLNMTQFQTDMASDSVYQAVQNDLAGGNNAGVSYTPSLYLNGKLLATPSTYDQLHQIIAQAIGK